MPRSKNINEALDHFGDTFYGTPNLCLHFLNSCPLIYTNSEGIDNNNNNDDDTELIKIRPRTIHPDNLSYAFWCFTSFWVRKRKLIFMNEYTLHSTKTSDTIIARNDYNQMTVFDSALFRVHIHNSFNRLRLLIR